MATYAELFDLSSDDALRNKIAVAVAVKAQALIDGATPSANELAWSAAAIANPIGKADELIRYVLAANKALSVAQIQGASDNAIQNNVDSAVDALVAGGIV